VTVSQALDRVLDGAGGRRSPSIMGWSFSRGCSKNGRIAAACNSMSFGRVDPSNMCSSAFIGPLRVERLNVHQFAFIVDAQAKIEAWRIDDNQHRPRNSLGHLTPNEFLRQRHVMRAAEAGTFLVETCLVTGPTSPSFPP
jgi:putative transposase